jgi:hypothetical protein
MRRPICDSTRFSCEDDSNEKDESDSHNEKHFEHTISTLNGIIID